MQKTNYPVSDGEKILLAGPAEANFLRLEERYQCSILTRNPGLVLQSASEDGLELTKLALDRFVQVIRSGQVLSESVRDELMPGNPGRKPAVPSASFEYYLQRPIVHDRLGKPVQPRTRGQAEFIKIVESSDVTFACGPAGTGKTFLAVALAVAYLRQQKVTRIVLVRPAVESGEYLGFLPGDLREKISPYMTPLFDALNTLIKPEILEEHRAKGEIEIAPLAYMRGRTLDSSFIILDEAQNITIPQMKMFLTRIGIQSKAVVAGDETQVDLPPSRKSGLFHARRILKGVKGISLATLTARDVVRHRIVKDIIEAYGAQKKKP